MNSALYRILLSTLTLHNTENRSTLFHTQHPLPIYYTIHRCRRIWTYKCYTMSVVEVAKTAKLLAMWGAKQPFTVQYAFCVAPTTCLHHVLMYTPGIAPGVVITPKQWPMLYRPTHTDHHCTPYKRWVVNTQCTISLCATATVHGAGGHDERIHNRTILAMEPVANLVRTLNKGTLSCQMWRIDLR